MASNLLAITAALRTRLATATGLTNVYAYQPEAISANMCFFVFDRFEVLDPPLGAQLLKWIFEGAFTVHGTNPETVETNIQTRMASLIDVTRADMDAGGTIGNGHVLLRAGTGRRQIVIGRQALPGAGFTLEVVEQVDGSYGLLG